ncbi:MULTISPECIES: DUF3800 domain-containing protein [unclassified Amycolatopsis]|uniref:DUF3800 domain-containing protein n=1 Tax=unclassified Amycolatopsis TaxID=2618356 RepID=UPI0028744C5F|nr:MULTISPECIES: DUF3800 domain-containing protein [unclassified Amycolatopsis]MDS0140545.1 DUF3800 domain-containing protein [Amycolatopsis sp. 505]MDS0149195.1 DUF3800 domain-containing protein [Amycolatopsis sp. CM201R]
MGVRVFYMDDSGSSEAGTVVFGWLELDLGDWQVTLRSWLDYRHQLHRSVGIPTDYELHATKFLSGRGNPTKTPWDGSDEERLRVGHDLLAHLASMPQVRVGAVYGQTTRRREARDLKARTYTELVRMIDARLTTDGELGMIVMDGDGTDPTYRAAHRELKLATRSLIEDPFFHGSHHSQWMQLADFIAYSAFMHIAQHPTKEKMWSWYSDLLGASAVTGPDPLELRTPKSR